MNEIDSDLKKFEPNWDKITNTDITLRFFTSSNYMWYYQYHITLSFPRDTMPDWHVAIIFLKLLKKLKN